MNDCFNEACARARRDADNGAQRIGLCADCLTATIREKMGLDLPRASNHVDVGVSGRAA